ncbi:MAG: hypothetical protein JWP03_2656 [Phycisphaerales bacterium]|nr:hypothetical protein [Phycisphaerales bacterium]
MTRSTAVTLARISWTAPLAAFLINMFLRRSHVDPATATDYELGRAQGQACVVYLCYITGLISGLAALRAVKQYGPAGISIPAGIGTILNTAMLAVSMLAILLPKAA